MGGEDGNRNKDNPSTSPNRPHQEKDDVKRWRVFLFGLIGATATTFAVVRLRRTVDWFYSQLSRSQSSWKGGNGNSFWSSFQEEALRRYNRQMREYEEEMERVVAELRRTVDSFYSQLSRSQSSWKGGNGNSFRSSFQEEAWRRYNRRMREEYEEEMERVERIRRMQSVFNRERNKYKRSDESWRESDAGAYHHHFQRDDWYWKTDTSFRDHRTNYRQPPRDSGNYSLSHHYSVLGLDRFRNVPYTEAEIKTAFRAKAKEFHPDQNQDNKEVAEAKFKEVMVSYEAIKQERKDMKL